VISIDTTTPQTRRYTIMWIINIRNLSFNQSRRCPSAYRNPSITGLTSVDRAVSVSVARLLLQRLLRVVRQVLREVFITEDTQDDQPTFLNTILLYSSRQTCLKPITTKSTGA